MDVGRRIKAARLKKGLSQEELGSAIGVKKAAIHKYESGLVVNLKRSTIDKLSRVLEVKPSYLLGYDIQDEDDGVDSIVEAFHKNKKLAILFSRSAKLKPEDLDIVLRMVERMDEEDDNEP